MSATDVFVTCRCGGRNGFHVQTVPICSSCGTRLPAGEVQRAMTAAAALAAAERASEVELARQHGGEFVIDLARRRAS